MIFFIEKIQTFALTMLGFKLSLNLG
uniref:Uncharacterized protein n=1 Tax=Arundo donax TaxID=35708 RepID=A0A0A9B3Z3_ARUDO